MLFKVVLILLDWNALNFSDKPKITSTQNHTTISAPSLFYVNVSVDSFPLSRVSIFHEKKRLTFLPNVTGQLSFNVSIESCLDQGKYRVEAVNDAGSDNITFIPDVKCNYYNMLCYFNMIIRRLHLYDAIGIMSSYIMLNHLNW